MQSAWFTAYILLDAMLLDRNYIFLFRVCSVPFALQTYYCDRGVLNVCAQTFQVLLYEYV